MAKSKGSSGLNLSGVLFIIFLILKLTDNIDWSWWWVTSPLWIPVCIAVGIGALALVIVILAMIFGMSLTEIKDRAENYKNRVK